MRTISLADSGLYDSRRGPVLRQAEQIVEQVHTLMDVFASQDEQPGDIKRNEPGRVALCDHAADRHDNPRLESLTEMMGNLTFDPETYQPYQPKAWRETAPPAEFHAVFSNVQGAGRVDYTRTEAGSHYKLGASEVIVDHARGTLTLLGDQSF